jgi:hypothetical protein
MLIYYSEIRYPKYKGFSKLIKGGKKLHFAIYFRTLVDFLILRLIVKVLGVSFDTHIYMIRL